MKKKLILSQSGKPPHDARSETGYEALRSAVAEGVEFHSDKARGLAVLITCGTYAWILQQGRSAGAQGAHPATMAQPRERKGAADCLAMLLANLVEPKPDGKSVHIEKESGVS